MRVERGKRDETGLERCSSRWMLLVKARNEPTNTNSLSFSVSSGYHALVGVLSRDPSPLFRLLPITHTHTHTDTPSPLPLDVYFKLLRVSSPSFVRSETSHEFCTFLGKRMSYICFFLFFFPVFFSFFFRTIDKITKQG